MTDNEIMKALDNLHNRKWIIAERDGAFITMGDIADFINRQNAEIEELKKPTSASAIFELSRQQERAVAEHSKYVAEIGAAAIRAFAERLVEKCYDHLPFSISVHPADIDNLVKEMVGENE